MDHTRIPITGVTVTPPDRRPVIRHDFLLSGLGTVGLAVQPTQHQDVWVATESTGGVPKGSVIVADHGTHEPVLGTLHGTLYPRGGFSAARGMDHAAEFYKDKLGRVYVAYEGLGWGLTMAWELDLATTEERQRYTELMLAVGWQLEGFRDQLLIDASGRALWASDPTDSAGRFNPMSRAAIICAAMRRLEGWVDVSPLFTEPVDARRFAIAAELDLAWAIRADVLLELVEISRWWNPDRIERLDREQGEKLARRFTACADRLDTIAIAPYGTHAFPKASADLREGASLFSAATGIWDSLRKLIGNKLDVTIRSLRLLEIHRDLEQVLTIVSLVDRGRIRFDGDDLVNLRARLEGNLRYLQTPGLDRSFKNPIVNDVRDHLTSVAMSTADDGGFDASMAKERLKLACACF